MKIYVLIFLESKYWTGFPETREQEEIKKLVRGTWWRSMENLK